MAKGDSERTELRQVEPGQEPRVGGNEVPRFGAVKVVFSADPKVKDALMGKEVARVIGDLNQRKSEK